MDREKVINYAEETLTNVLPDEKDTSGIMVKVGWIREVLYLLKEQEAIVRCKDCKKYGDEKKCPIEALINSDSKQFFAFDDDWYCADGVKKDD